MSNIYPAGGKKFVLRVRDAGARADLTAPFTVEITTEQTLGPLTGIFTLAENASENSAAGSLGGVSSGSILSLVPGQDAGGRVAISGSRILRGPVALDFETAPDLGNGNRGYAFTVRESLSSATNGPFRDTPLHLIVTDVVEGGVAVATVAPSGTYNGASGSGWSGNQPTRTADTLQTSTTTHIATADLREYFGDHLRVTSAGRRVYVFGGANRADKTLGPKLGLSQVEFLYEGGTATVTDPAVHTRTDVNGKTVKQFGWACDLQYNGVNGTARLWIRGTPEDPAKLPRTIGPFIFYPSDAAVPVLNIDWQAPQVTGSQYQTLDAAMQYAMDPARNWGTYILNVIRQNPVDSPYLIHSGAAITTHAGRCIIQGSVPFTVGGAPGTNYPEMNGLYKVDYKSGVPFTQARAKRIEFRGENCTLDFRWLREFADGHDIFGNGANIINSGGMARRWAGGGSNFRKLVWKPNRVSRTNLQYWQDCHFDGINDPAKEAYAIVNCQLDNGTEDIFTGTSFIYGNTVDNWGKHVHNYQPAFTFYYDGAGNASADWLASTTAGAYRDFILKVDTGSGPVEVGRYPIYNGEGNFLVNGALRPANYQIKHIVDWINSLPRSNGAGFKASLVDNSTRAGQLSRLVLGSSGFPQGSANGTLAGGPWPSATIPGSLAVNKTVSAPTWLYTYLDAHSDFMAMQGLNENQITVCNRALRTYGNIVYWLGNSVGAHDYMFLNNIIEGLTAIVPGTNIPYLLNTPYQQITAPCRNLMFDHNTFTGHENFVKNTVTPESSYSNNIVPRLEWTGAPGARVAGNHSMASHNDPDASQTGFSFGGSKATLFANPAADNYAPAGLLLDPSNLVIPSVPFDIDHNPRNMAGDAKGAVRIAA